MIQDTPGRGAHVIVRRAGLPDARMLAELGERTFRESFSAENTPQNMTAYVSKAFDVATIARDIADAGVTYLIGEIDGRASAYAMVRAVTAPGSVRGHAPLELVRFYVDRPWHGSGVARTLMNACDEEARSGSASGSAILARFASMRSAASRTSARRSSCSATTSRPIE
jgi:GNAT superfamily N-acetyltransferase